MELILKDFTFAWRMLGQRKLFTAAAVLTIGLGIGVVTAIFSVVYGVLLRPLPYWNPGELVLVWKERPEMAGRVGAVSAQSYLDWREKNSVFTDMAAFRPRNSTVATTQDAGGDRIRGAAFTVNTLGLLGVQPFLGRGFTAEEGKRGNETVVLLGFGLWQSRFGGDQGILGRTIYIEGSPHTVVGVMPRGFEFPLGTLYWTPQAPEQFLMNFQGAQPGARFEIAALQVIGRLKPGVSIETAEKGMVTLEKQLRAGLPDDNQSRLKAESLLESIVGKTRTILLVFSGAVVFVLLIACANVANLLLSRASSREREIAVRAALGASRWRLVRQLLSESVVIAMMGALCGLVLAYGGMKLFLALNPGNVPRVDHVRMDWPVMLFSVAAAIVTGILFGLVPAIGATRSDLMHALKEGSGGAGAAQSRRGRIRGALVLVETALAVVLLAGAGLLLRSFVRMANLDTGMDTKNVIAANVFPNSGRTMNMGGGMQFQTLMSTDTNSALKEAMERLAALPGVESVAFASSLPPGGMRSTASPLIEGKTTNPDALPEAQVLDVSATYFPALRVAIVEGRSFQLEDVEDKRNLTVVSETFVRKFLPGERAVGRRFLAGDELWEIIGVAKDVRQSDLKTPPDAVMYRPRIEPMVRVGQRMMAGGSSLIVRTKGDPGPQMAAVKTTLEGMSSRLRVMRLSLLDTEVWKDLAQPKFYLAVIAIFAGVAMLLSAIGIYGVLAYSVSQRTQEIGVRLALGADRGDILRMVIRQGMTPALLGVAGGIGASLWLTRYLTSVLFEVKPTDVMTYAGVAVVLALVALVACLVPARRATRVDPMTALRYE